MASGREFHLVQDIIPNDPGAQDASSTRPTKLLLVVPGGISYLIHGAEDQLQIAATQAEKSAHGQLILEPNYSGPQPQLLLIRLGEAPVFVNGRVAPPICVLGEGDQFQFDVAHVLHVLLFNRPDIGPPSDRSIGGACPICRTQIQAEMRVYTCLNCGTAMHFQGAETPPELRLECALSARACVSCSAKIELSEGYGWEPER